jgi:hypothetical protein
VIVQYRSKGFLCGGSGDEYPIFPLAAAGFAVLSFDRPTDMQLAARYAMDDAQSLASYMAAQTHDSYRDWQALSALESILTTLDKRGIIDLRAVGITGLSNGAETVDFALFNSKSFAAAAESGMWSPDYYDLAVNDQLRAQLRAENESTSRRGAIAMWRQRALAYHAEDVVTPTLFQVSDRELIQVAPNIIALKDAGKPVEAYVFPDEYHIKWQPQHKLAVADRAIDWFRFWLQGYEDPAESKTRQYRRWEQLCNEQKASNPSRPSFCIGPQH